MSAGIDSTPTPPCVPRTRACTVCQFWSPLRPQWGQGQMGRVNEPFQFSDFQGTS